MDTVPTEIAYEILSYLPERDFGSLRLVNRFFNAVANNRYFQTIRIPFTDATIKNLMHLSHQPHVARCVQRLIYPYYQPKKPPSEISTDLVGREFCENDYEWTETSIVRNVDYSRMMGSINFNEQLWAKVFTELLAGASQAQTRLDKLTIHSIWRSFPRNEANTPFGNHLHRFFKTSVL
ncbi:hypothetical protein RUND412_007788 [Rhizina undulata]